ncbi:alpha-L-rhamnosidase C-terminal domain-containing protein [Streptomyces sp. TG1A-60]|uniref:alpha-L-rhamnosidase C-terminal domain-containing protein n=1 Tax=Streptomyces sp. TG1A-60 TaxID=3129111 RepID=UPI0030D00B06
MRGQGRRPGAHRRQGRGRTARRPRRGVRVSEPGAAGFRIRPRTGSLTEAEGTVPSVRGPVSVRVRRSESAHTTRVTVPPNSRAVLEVEIGSARPRAYRVKGTAPGGKGRVKVESFTDVTGTVLRIGPVGSGTTEVRGTMS